MSPCSLSFVLRQPDDGDGLARFEAIVESDSFAGKIQFWGYAEQFDELAEKLKGFPASPESRVEHALGSPGVGLCEMKFECIDGVGHVAVWAELEAEHPVFPSNEYQKSKQCILVDPASVDQFYVELKGLGSGSEIRASIYGK